MSFGYLKLKYGYSDDTQNLSVVSFVLDKDEYSPALGMTPEFSIFKDETNDTVTYISENGISGFQWSNGEVFWRHTYDDDSPSSNGKKISLDDWIDECLDKIINPSVEEIEEYKRME